MPFTSFTAWLKALSTRIKAKRPLYICPYSSKQDETALCKRFISCSCKCFTMLPSVSPCYHAARKPTGQSLTHSTEVKTNRSTQNLQTHSRAHNSYCKGLSRSKSLDQCTSWVSPASLMHAWLVVPNALNRDQDQPLNTKSANAQPWTLFIL